MPGPEQLDEYDPDDGLILSPEEAAELEAAEDEADREGAWLSLDEVLRALPR